MKVVTDISEMAALSVERRRRGWTIGFVPTMGYLHKGHLSLVRLARERARWIVASVFVNPTQFGPGEDYDQYPRDRERDRALLEAEGCDVMFFPSAEAMYPHGFSTTVSVGDLAEKLCGRSRPGHFDGVATVVLELLNIVRPDLAVFGEKDAQQLAVIRRMVSDLNTGVEIVGGPTVRESDGIAASSRNAYLSPEERKQATCLVHALEKAQDLVRSGETRAESVVEAMRRVIESEPLARIDYVSVVDPESLEDLEVLPREALAALAVRVGDTRLIDNVRLVPGE